MVLALFTPRALSPSSNRTSKGLVLSLVGPLVGLWSSILTGLPVCLTR